MMPVYKDKEVEVMSKTEALWTKVKERTEQIIEDAKINLEINEMILKMAQEKIDNENQ